MSLASRVELELAMSAVRDRSDGAVEFRRAYRSRFAKKKQRRAHEACLESIDRWERELGIGPYNPLQLELDRALAEGVRAEQRKRQFEIDEGLHPIGCDCMLCSGDSGTGTVTASLHPLRDYTRPERSYYIKLDGLESMPPDQRAKAMERQVRTALTSMHEPPPALNPATPTRREE